MFLIKQSLLQLLAGNYDLLVMGGGGGGGGVGVIY